MFKIDLWSTIMDDLDNKAIQKLLFRFGSEIVDIAQDNAPYVSGNLHNDIQIFDENLTNLEIEVGNSLLTPYAPFVHEGTGIYGKYKRKITPKKGKAMKTPWGYRTSIKGQKAQPYLSDAVQSYISSGAFDKAIDAAGDEISEDIFKNLKESLKNTSIK